VIVTWKEVMKRHFIFKYCRAAVYSPTFNTLSRSDWMAAGEKGGILENAENILEEILENHKAPSLPEDVAREIDAIIERADQRLN
jgi:trimethylamine:corrinoid methyltransferase-like protein